MICSHLINKYIYFSFFKTNNPDEPNNFDTLNLDN